MRTKPKSNWKKQGFAFVINKGRNRGGKSIKKSEPSVVTFNYF